MLILDLSQILLRNGAKTKEVTFSFQTELQTRLSKSEKISLEFHIGVNEDSEKNTCLSHFEICSLR